MYKDKIKLMLTEELTKADKKVIQTMIDDSMGDFIKNRDFEKKIEKLVTSNLKVKGNKKIEKEIVDITKNVITQLYRTLWVRRNFWKNSITNK